MKKHTLGTMMILGLLLLVSGCSKMSVDPNSIDALASSSTAQTQVKLSIEIYDSSNNLVYDDSNSSSSLLLKSGQNYSLFLIPSHDLPGAVYTLEITQINIVNGTPQSLILQPGANNFSVSQQGDYSLKLVAQADSMLDLTKYYNANVSCASPTFTADSLNANAITVAAGTASNLYSFSAAGLTSGANGQAPYSCAWDPTGSGILDTNFRDCNTVLKDFYVNYVSDRKVSVAVKDSCNTVYTVSKFLNLPYSVPAMGAQNVFIFGQVSDATGVADNDLRTDDVSYFATNAGGNNIVQPNFSSGNFTITSTMKYGMSSSIKFGMSISVQGITGTIDVANQTGSLDASAASIKSVSYTTDQSGDVAAALSFSGSNCTLTNQGVLVIFAGGIPCTPDQTGTGNKATVEVWGEYECQALSASGGTINIKGSFDGLKSLVDSCIGGGGGGGGGIVPIRL